MALSSHQQKTEKEISLHEKGKWLNMFAVVSPNKAYLN